MIDILEFPGLGFVLEIDRVAFTLPRFLGGFPVYWYGVLIALGFFLAVSYALARAKTFGLDDDRMFDVVIIAIISGIIGARLFSVIFSWTEYKDNLISILNIRGGGLAIYGGIIFGVLGAFVGAKIRKVQFLPLLDLCVGSLFIGQAVGRWGNFVNIEAFGGNTTLPWGMTGPSIVNYLSNHKTELEAIGMTIDPRMPVHPTFFYEFVWCALGFALILFLTNRRRFDGQLSLVYFGWYGLGRAFIEGLRTDSLMLGGVRISQLIAILCVIGSLLVLISIFSRIRREGDPDYLMLYVNTVEGQQVLAGTFYEDKKKKKKKGKGVDKDKESDDDADESIEDKAEKDDHILDDGSEEADESFEDKAEKDDHILDDGSEEADESIEDKAEKDDPILDEDSEEADKSAEKDDPTLDDESEEADESAEDKAEEESDVSQNN